MNILAYHDRGNTKNTKGEVIFAMDGCDPDQEQMLKSLVVSYNTLVSEVRFQKALVEATRKSNRRF